MKNTPSTIFDQKCASSYDEKRARLSPMKSALHLLMRMILADLPANARILCVGAGTGAELIELAQAYPQWQFTAIEPAKAMLDKCKQLTEEAGVASRCTYHEGYLDSLPECDDFDAATSILVSQFLMQTEERQDFFQQISKRLCPAGILINADLASDMQSPEYAELLQVWKQTMGFAELPAKDIENLGIRVAVSPTSEVSSIISSGGFTSPTLFFQTILIHAWFAKRV